MALHLILLRRRGAFVCRVPGKGVTQPDEGRCANLVLQKCIWHRQEGVFSISILLTFLKVVFAGSAVSPRVPSGRRFEPGRLPIPGC